MNQQGLMTTLGYPGTKQSVTSTGAQASPYGSAYGGSIAQGGIDSYIQNQKNQLASTQPSTIDYNALANAMYSAFKPYTPTARYFDTGAAYSQARQQATAAVDPYYNKLINEFNTQVGAQQQQATQQNQLDLATIQQQLQNTLQQNTITGQRVGEDTSTALGNLANAQQNYKQTEGLQFDQAQRALQGNQGAAGTTESGMGQQQQELAQTQERLGQQAQGQQYQTQRQAEQLFMNRSVEDLTRGGEIAKGQAGLQTQGAQLNLNKTMTSIAMQQEQQLNQFEQQRQSQIASTQGGIYDQLLGNFYNSLKGIDPRDLSATMSRYGAGI